MLNFSQENNEISPGILKTNKVSAGAESFFSGNRNMLKDENHPEGWLSEKLANCTTNLTWIYWVG
jgi:hypothetical protein